MTQRRLASASAYLAAALMQASAPAQAQGPHQHGPAGAHSKYAGQQSRAIKSLSEEDLAELRRGGGWGLAKAAELNGVPGPAHLLELKREIGLSDAQVEAITALFEDMQTKAVAHGKTLIARERKLDEAFRNSVPSEDALREMLNEIAQARAALRFVHLSAHLKTPAIVSAEQIAKYNALRGYGAADPCSNVPSGHDARMWRLHNGCK